MEALETITTLAKIKDAHKVAEKALGRERRKRNERRT
jgi:hypothetical protein